MPPRSTPPPKSSFYPQNDNTTYRDLLLFEERLKTNAASLQSRKSRYQCMILTFLSTMAQMQLYSISLSVIACHSISTL
jgi:hypothetical protein